MKKEENYRDEKVSTNYESGFYLDLDSNYPTM